MVHRNVAHPGGMVHWSLGLTLILRVYATISFVAAVSFTSLHDDAGQDSLEGQGSRLLEERLDIAEEDDGCLLQSTVFRKKSVISGSSPPATHQALQPGSHNKTASSRSISFGPAIAGHSVTSAPTRRRRRSLASASSRRRSSVPVFTQISQDTSRAAFSQASDIDAGFDEGMEAIARVHLNTSSTELTQIPWWWSLRTLIIPISLSSAMLWIFRQWFIKFVQPLSSEDVASSSAPKPEDNQEIPATFCDTCEHVEAPRSGVTLMIPLLHEIDMSSPHVFNFDVLRQSHVQPLHVNISCIPDGEIWAKIVLSLQVPGLTCGHVVPLASCSLVDRSTSIETGDIKGVMQSWLALLMHERQMCEFSTVGSSDEAKVSEVCVNVSLHGVAEVLSHLGEVPLEHYALEFRDGLNNFIGSLEPCSAGHYALMRDDRPIVEIEGGPQSHSFLFSRQGDVIALAKSTAEPEHSQLSGNPDESMQLDVYGNAFASARDCSWVPSDSPPDVGGEPLEEVLLLLCTVSMIVFNLKL